jgi:hypothetical protein
VVTLLDQDNDFRDLHHVLKLSGLARMATVREQKPQRSRRSPM